MIEPQSQLRFHKARNCAHVIDIEGNVAALGGARHERAGFRALRDEHHEEAMRAESRCPTATAEKSEWCLKSDGEGMLIEHLQWNLDLC